MRRHYPFSDYASQRIITSLVRMEYTRFRQWIDTSAEVCPI